MPSGVTNEAGVTGQGFHFRSHFTLRRSQRSCKKGHWELSGALQVGERFGASPSTLLRFMRAALAVAHIDGGEQLRAAVADAGEAAAAAEQLWGALDSTSASKSDGLLATLNLLISVLPLLGIALHITHCMPGELVR